MQDLPPSRPVIQQSPRIIYLLFRCSSLPLALLESAVFLRPLAGKKQNERFTRLKRSDVPLFVRAALSLQSCRLCQSQGCSGGGGEGGGWGESIPAGRGGEHAQKEGGGGGVTWTIFPTSSV